MKLRAFAAVVPSLLRRYRLTRSLWRHRAQLAGMIRDFAVTLAGVLLALHLSTGAQDRTADAATLSRIRMAELEAQYAGTNGLEAYRHAEANQSGALFLMSFDLVAAQALLEDDHSPDVLPAHVLSLLKTYIAAAMALQRSIDVQRDFGVVTGFTATPSSSDLLALIRNNAASLVAVACVVQEQLKPFSGFFDPSAITSVQARINEVKDAVLADKVRLSSDPASP